MYQRLEEELLVKGYEKQFIVLVKRIKRHNLLHSLFFGPTRSGYLTFKDKTITFFPFKKYYIDYQKIKSFTIDDLILHKCSISKGSHTPTMGLLTIKYKDKKKEEFMFHTRTYYDTISNICNLFFYDNSASAVKEDANEDS